VKVNKDKVIWLYRLIKDFCIGYNTTRTEKDDIRKFVPEAIRTDLMMALGQDQTLFDQISEAMKVGKIVDISAALPDQVPSSVPQSVIDFVEKMESAEVLQPIETSIEELKVKIDKITSELREKRIQGQGRKPK